MSKYKRTKDISESLALIIEDLEWLRADLLSLPNIPINEIEKEVKRILRDLKEYVVLELTTLRDKEEEKKNERSRE